MSIETTPFNPMDFLKTDDEIATYLTEAYRDDDPAVFIVALGHVVKQKGLAQLAEDERCHTKGCSKEIESCQCGH